MAQCVNNLDFEVVQGVLRQRTHAARMLNNVAIREVPSSGGDVGDPEFEWTIPGFDNLDYQYGSAIVADPGSGRFIVKNAGIYNVAAAIGDNEFETNDGATLYLTLYVGGASRLRGSATKVGGNKAWPSLAGDVQIQAGETVFLSYTVRICNPPPPPDPPFCGRANHFLYPDNRNFFSIHRVGALV